MQSATLAYDQNDLSSRVIYDSDKNGFYITHRRINFADLNGCDTDYLYTASLTAEPFSYTGNNRCAPDILMPTGLYRAFPGWSECIDSDPSYQFEIWDPPRVLLSVTALDAPEDKVTTASRDATPSHTPSSAITGPGLEVPVPETRRSTATCDGTSPVVATDPHLQSSSTHDRNGDGQKMSGALDDSSTGRTARVSQARVSLNSAETLPSITAIVYTTHYQSTDPSSSSSTSLEKTNIITSSSAHPVNQASNNPDHPSSTENLDNPTNPTQPHSSIATSSYPTTHPQDPTYDSKASDTAHAQASTALSTKDPSGASSTIRTTSPAAVSSNRPTGIAAWIIAGFSNRLPEFPSSTQQQHLESTSPPLRTAATAASTTVPHRESTSASSSAGELSSGTSSSTNPGFTGLGLRKGIGLGEIVIWASSLLLLLLLLLS